MLENVFAGPDGIAARLVALLGGVGRIKIRWDESGAYEIREIPYAVVDERDAEGPSPTPGGRTWETNAVSNGLRRLEALFSCYVPSSSLDAKPRVGIDLFCVDDRDYSIERVDCVRAGGEVVLYQLTCSRR
ncbi:MAG: hypothetical protein IKX88_07385 [Thermoguttaceae bacterium]|jgi:hypothetical protein|nr:hypothetical protein [Thermoguttaceae bacterium]MBR5758400.1 hypothetical protein [Thermoguttaceae bacterium]